MDNIKRCTIVKTNKKFGKWLQTSNLNHLAIGSETGNICGDAKEWVPKAQEEFGF